MISVFARNLSSNLTPTPTPTLTPTPTPTSTPSSVPLIQNILVMYQMNCGSYGPFLLTGSSVSFNDAQDYLCSNEMACGLGVTRQTNGDPTDPQNGDILYYNGDPIQNSQFGFFWNEDNNVTYKDTWRWITTDSSGVMTVTSFTPCPTLTPTPSPSVTATPTPTPTETQSGPKTTLNITAIQSFTSSLTGLTLWYAIVPSGYTAPTDEYDNTLDWVEVGTYDPVGDCSTTGSSSNSLSIVITGQPFSFTYTLIHFRNGDGTLIYGIYDGLDAYCNYTTWSNVYQMKSGTQVTNIDQFVNIQFKLFNYTISTAPPPAISPTPSVTATVTPTLTPSPTPTSMSGSLLLTDVWIHGFGGTGSTVASEGQYTTGTTSINIYYKSNNGTDHSSIFGSLNNNATLSFSDGTNTVFYQLTDYPTDNGGTAMWTFPVTYLYGDTWIPSFPNLAITIKIWGTPQSPTPTPSNTQTLTPTITPTTSNTATPTITPSATSTPLPSLSPSPTLTPTVTPTHTPTPSPVIIEFYEYTGGVNTTNLGEMTAMSGGQDGPFSIEWGSIVSWRFNKLSVLGPNNEGVLGRIPYNAGTVDNSSDFSNFGAGSTITLEGRDYSGGTVNKSVTITLTSSAYYDSSSSTLFITNFNITSYTGTGMTQSDKFKVTINAQQLTPTPTVSSTPTITPTNTPASTTTPTPTATPTNTITPSITVSPSFTPTPSATYIPQLSGATNFTISGNSGGLDSVHYDSYNDNFAFVSGGSGTSVSYFSADENNLSFVSYGTPYQYYSNNTNYSGGTGSVYRKWVEDGDKFVMARTGPYFGQYITIQVLDKVTNQITSITGTGLNDSSWNTCTFEYIPSQKLAIIGNFNANGSVVLAILTTGNTISQSVFTVNSFETSSYSGVKIKSVVHNTNSDTVYFFTSSPIHYKISVTDLVSAINNQITNGVNWYTSLTPINLTQVNTVQLGTYNYILNDYVANFYIPENNTIHLTVYEGSNTTRSKTLIWDCDLDRIVSVPYSNILYPYSMYDSHNRKVWYSAQEIFSGSGATGNNLAQQYGSIIFGLNPTDMSIQTTVPQSVVVYNAASITVDTFRNRLIVLGTFGYVQVAELGAVPTPTPTPTPTITPTVTPTTYNSGVMFDFNVADGYSISYDMDHVSLSSTVAVNDRVRQWMDRTPNRYTFKEIDELTNPSVFHITSSNFYHNKGMLTFGQVSGCSGGTTVPWNSSQQYVGAGMRFTGLNKSQMSQYTIQIYFANFPGNATFPLFQPIYMNGTTQINETSTYSFDYSAAVGGQMWVYSGSNIRVGALGAIYNVSPGTGDADGGAQCYSMQRGLFTVVVDGTQSSTADRVKFYMNQQPIVNGVNGTITQWNNPGTSDPARYDYISGYQIGVESGGTAHIHYGSVKMYDYALTSSEVIQTAGEVLTEREDTSFITPTPTNTVTPTITPTMTPTPSATPAIDSTIIYSFDFTQTGFTYDENNNIVTTDGDGIEFIYDTNQRYGVSGYSAPYTYYRPTMSLGSSISGLNGVRVSSNSNTYGFKLTGFSIKTTSGFTWSTTLKFPRDTNLFGVSSSNTLPIFSYNGFNQNNAQTFNWAWFPNIYFRNHNYLIYDLENGNTSTTLLSQNIGEGFNVHDEHTYTVIADPQTMLSTFYIDGQQVLQHSLQNRSNADLNTITGVSITTNELYTYRKPVIIYENTLYSTVEDAQTINNFYLNKYKTYNFPSTLAGYSPRFLGIFLVNYVSYNNPNYTSYGQHTWVNNKVADYNGYSYGGGSDNFGSWRWYLNGIEGFQSTLPSGQSDAVHSGDGDSWFNLNGTSSYMNLSGYSVNGMINTYPDYSITVTVRFNTLTPDQTIFSIKQNYTDLSSGLGDSRITLSTGGTVNVLLRASNNPSGDVNLSGSLPSGGSTGTTYVMVLSKSGSTYSFHINNVLQSTDTSTDSIGRWTGSSTFNDYFMIGAMYNASVPSMAQYLDGDIGTVIFQRTGYDTTMSTMIYNTIRNRYQN